MRAIGSLCANRWLRYYRHAALWDGRQTERQFQMRLRTAGTLIGAAVILSGSFIVTLTALRHMETAHRPDSSTKATIGSKRSARTTRVALDSVYVQPGCSFSGDSSERLLTTLTQPGSYGVVAPAPFPPFSVGPGKIRARLQVLEGQIGILIEGQIGQGLVIAQKVVDVTNEPVQVEVDVPDVAAARNLVLRTTSQNGTRTRARIFYLEGVV